MTPPSHDLTGPLGSASQAASQHAQASGKRADLREAALQTYPQIYSHVDKHD